MIPGWILDSIQYSIHEFEDYIINTYELEIKKQEGICPFD